MKLPHLFTKKPTKRVNKTRLSIDTLEARDVPAAFTPGNIVLYRVGDGTATLTANGNATFLDEFTPAGALVQTIALPTTVNGAQKQLVAGLNPTEGLMTRSANGESLIMTGYAAVLGGAVPLATSASATINRTVGVVNAFGAIDTRTALTNVADTNEIRTATSTNGSDIWVVGAGSLATSGIHYTTIGSTTATQISNVEELRQVAIFNGQLYASNDISPNQGVGTIGTGLPTVAGQIFTRLPGLPSTASAPNGFFFADLSAAVSGLDTLYIADNSALALSKYSFNTTTSTWDLNGTVGSDGDDYRSLTATVSGSTVTLYATRKALAGTGGELVTLLDSTGYNGAFTGTPNVLATAAANTGYRGVALAPVKINSAPINTLPATFTTSEDANFFLTGTAVFDADSGVNPVVVTLSVTAGTLIVNTGVAGGVTAAQVANNSTGTVTITAPVGAISTTLLNSGVAFTLGQNNSGTATLTMTTADQGFSGTDGPKSDVDVSTITVNAVNDAPTFIVGADQAVDEDAGAQTVANFATNISPGPADEAAQVLTFEVSTDNNALFSVPPQINPTTGALTYTPAANVFGVANITVRLKDNGGVNFGGDDTSDDVFFKITVRSSNDAPSFTDGGNIVVNEDSAAQVFANFVANISVGPANESGQLITAAPLTTNNDGLFSVVPFIDINSNELKFTPAPNAFGVANVQLRLKDNGGTANNGQEFSVVHNFTITINSVNDPPSFVKGADQLIVEDAGLQTVPGWATSVNTGAPNESIQNVFSELVSTSNNTLFTQLPSVANNGTLTYQMAPNASGVVTVTLHAKDTGGTANGGVDIGVDQTFTITINAVNDAPSFVKGADEVITEDAGAQTVTGWATSILNGGADENSQTLTFEITNNTNTTLFLVQPAVAANGTLTYTPALNASGTAQVTLRLKDNGGTANGGQDTSNTQTFFITVNPVNDAPVLNDAQFYLPPNAAVGYDAGTVTATDVENDDITYSIDPSSDPFSNFSIDPATGLIELVSLTNLPTINTLTVFATDDGIPNAQGSATVDVRFNTRPVLDTTGTPMLSPIPVRGKVLPAGDLLSVLTENITDADPGADQGIAIVGRDNAKGVWQYNLTGAANDWLDVPNATPTAAFLLADDGSTMIRFVPNAKFTGFANLTFKAWDTENGFDEGTTQDTTTTDTSYSTDTDRGWIAVGRTVPAVNADGAVVLKAVKEDAKLSSVFTAKNLLGIAGLESAPTTNLGLAVTNVSTASGTWEYKPTGTKLWLSFVGVGETTAILLKPTDQLRFKPTANADTEGVISFKTWDQSTTNTDTTVGTAFGADPGVAVVDITAVNDAPVLDLSKAAILNAVGASAETNHATIGSLMSVSDVENDLNAVSTGVAVYKVSGGDGSWWYRPNGAVDPIKFPVVSTKKALLLDADTEIFYKSPSIILKPFTASLSFKAFDKSVVGAANTPKAISGTAFSTTTEIVTVAVGNHAPTLADGNPTLISIKTTAKPGSGTLVKSLLGTALTDTDAKALKGIAITSVDSTNGQWQYLSGKVWVTITGVSDTSALLLKDTNRIRFVPNLGFTGTATIKYKGWDQSTGQAGDVGVDTTSAALNSFSTFEETAGITVTV